MCEYYNCTTDGGHCVQGYEVCDENPVWVGDACIAAFQHDNNKPEVHSKGCFICSGSTCHETCVLREFPTNVYSCLCNTTLCNSNANLIVPSIHMLTSIDLPTGKQFSLASLVYISVKYTLNAENILDPGCVAPFWGSSHHWSEIFLHSIV